MEKMTNFFKLVSHCAKRGDILLQIYDGFICVYVGEGPERASMTARCGDEQALGHYLQELTTGKYSKGTRRKLNGKVA